MSAGQLRPDVVGGAVRPVAAEAVRCFRSCKAGSASNANPIGVDFGSDGLRMAQVESVNGEYRLIAAARPMCLTHVRNDPHAKLTFFAETVRELLGQGNFRGRKAILSLPASVMTIQHLRDPQDGRSGAEAGAPLGEPRTAAV